jgi:hypothetical protein
VVEAGADPEKGRDLSPDADTTPGGLMDPRNDPHQGALARPVPTHHAEDLAMGELERNAVDGAHELSGGPSRKGPDGTLLEGKRLVDLPNKVHPDLFQPNGKAFKSRPRRGDSGLRHGR